MTQYDDRNGIPGGTDRHRDLVRGIVHDQIVEIRCAERDGQPEYAASCRAQLRALWPIRHTARLDAYGWPEVWTK